MQAELLAQQRLRVGDQLVHLLLDDLDSVLLDEGQSTPRSPASQAAICAKTSPWVDLRDANVAQDEAHHLVVELAGADEVDRRDVERLAVGRRGLAVKASRDRPSGIRPVRRVLDEGHQLALGEHRLDGANILRVRPAEKRVVHQDDVAFREAILSQPLDDGLDRVRQRADVRREVVLAFRDEASVAVADRGAEVTALADDERVRHALEHQPHLVDDAHRRRCAALEVIGSIRSGRVTMVSLIGTPPER